MLFFVQSQSQTDKQKQEINIQITPSVCLITITFSPHNLFYELICNVVLKRHMCDVG